MGSNDLFQRLSLQSEDPSLTYKPLHSQIQAASFDHLHSCAHCQHISINAEDLREKPLTDQDENKPWNGTKCSYEIGRGLEQAIAASKSGCALFEWFLDALVKNRYTIPHIVESFEQIVFSLEFHTSEKMSCRPVFDGLVRVGDRARFHRDNNYGPLVLPSLDVCVREDDPASNIIMQRPPEFDMFSERSIQFGKNCLTTCLKYHEQCRTEWLRADLSREELVTRQLEDTQIPDETIALDDLPTRLLRIETAPDDTILVRLLEMSNLTIEEREQVAADGFTALSYCWGKEGNPVQLTSETLDVLKQGIPISKLPATISDAMHFSHSILLEYIWVDALCIFQDDDQDKDIEIRRMGAYYGANTMTLCAASADGSSKGLRDSIASTHHGTPPLGLACRVGESTGQIILRSRPDAREHITGRGWTLQESLLSRRILIFSHQLYWCCVSANAECEGSLATLPKKAGRNFGRPESLVPGIHPAQVLRDYPPDFQWQLGLEDFVKRRLGVVSDKLLAISAFASWVHARYRACIRADYSYVAGLFMSTEEPYYLAKQLLWRPKKTPDCTRPLKYRAPSWSWAAVDGELQFRFDQKWQLQDPTFVLEGFDLRLAYAAAPYGSVKHAALNLSGCRIQPLQSCLNSQVHMEEEPDVTENSNEGVYLIPDTPQDGHLIQSALDVSTSFPLFLCQIAISGARNASDGHPRRPPSHGLIIMPVPGEELNNFRRVGVFILHHVRHEGETDESTELRKFFDVEGQNIILL